MWGRSDQTWEFTWDLGMFLQGPNVKKGSHDGCPFVYLHLPFGSDYRAFTPVAGCALRSGRYKI